MSFPSNIRLVYSSPAAFDCPWDVSDVAGDVDGNDRLESRLRGTLEQVPIEASFVSVDPVDCR